jgi:hypothetical protein
MLNEDRCMRLHHTTEHSVTEVPFLTTPPDLSRLQVHSAAAAPLRLACCCQVMMRHTLHLLHCTQWSRACCSLCSRSRERSS